MRSRIAKSLCIVSVSAIAGCFPFYPMTDYWPEMPGAKVSEGRCLGFWTAQYKIDEVTVHAAVAIYPRIREKEPQLNLGFSVPESKVLELVSADVTVSSPVAPASVRLTIPELTNGTTRESVSPLKPMVGGPVQLGGKTFSRYFHRNLSLSPLPVGDYRVELPDMKVNGKVVKIPAATFKRTPRVEFMVPVNC